MFTCTLNNLTRVIQQFRSFMLPYDILGRSWNLSFQAQACVRDWVGTSTVLGMVTSEAAVGIIKRPLCLSISTDDSLCVPALLAGMILQVSDPSPRSAAAADVKAVQTSSYCARCHHLLLTCQCSCAPLIHTARSGNSGVAFVSQFVSHLQAIGTRSPRLLGVCMKLATHGRLPNLFMCLTFPI